MVNKRTIGKIQLWIGIILLIGSIVGLFIDFRWTMDQTGVDWEGQLGQNDILSLMGQILRINLGANLGVVLVLSILISILFITQGLANMSTNEVRYR